MRLTLRAIVFGLGAVGLVLPTGGAGAHDAQQWFNPIAWDTLDVDYRIDDSVSGSGGSMFEDRLHDGAGEWNAISGVGGFDFDDTGNGNRSWAQPCNWEDDATDIWVFQHDIGSTGQMLQCQIYRPGQDITLIESARVVLDTDGPWYKGTGNVPDGEVSVWEISAHEFGHATGTYISGPNGGHWPGPPSNQCSIGGAEADWTMCPSGFAGFAYLIPLEPHDIDTFQDFY